MSLTSMYILGRIPEEMQAFKQKINFPQFFNLKFSNFLFSKPSEVIFHKNHLFFYQRINSDHILTFPRNSKQLPLLNHQKINPCLKPYSQFLFPIKNLEKMEITSGPRYIYLFLPPTLKYYFFTWDEVQENFQRKHFNQISSYCLPGNEIIKKISSGISHALFLTACGKLYGVGSNTDAQLAQSDGPAFSIPIKINLPSDDDFAVDMECGNDFNFVKTTNGNWYSWGNNEYSQLFIDSDEKKIFKPTRSNLSSFRADEIKLGATFGIAKENDNVIEWGCLSSPGLKKAGSLGEVVYKNFKNVKKIGACHLNATVLADGDLYIWGQNHDNMFGIDSESFFLSSPTKLNLNFKVKDSKIMKHLLVIRQ